MISVANVSAGQARNYYKVDDYYTAGLPPTEWRGSLAEVLGLTGAPTAEVFAQILAGQLPNGEKIHRGGTARRAATDLTFSAPKSVSIAALVAGDGRVQAAHSDAVRKTLEKIEKLVGARITEDKVTRLETTEKALIAIVQHETSRAGDPNLHHHCLLMNVTQLPDGRWRAIENREVFRRRHDLDRLYKAELAKRLVELGYHIRLTRDGFELAHITREQIEHFSQRSKDIESDLKAQGLTRSDASAQKRQISTSKTRDRKVEFNREQLRADWNARATMLGIILEPPTPDAANLEASLHAAPKAVDWAITHLAEREQAWSEKNLVDASTDRALGFCLADDIRREINARIGTGSLLRKEDGTLTTPEAVERELRILHSELSGRGAVRSVLDMERLTPEAKARIDAAIAGLSEGQKAAVSLAATSTNRIIGVQGFAGTGKTTMLKTFRSLASEAGYELVGLGPTRSAVLALNESGIEASTVQRWLVSKSESPISEKSIVILDESSLNSIKNFEAVVAKVNEAGARMIVLGDTSQYEAVEAGKMFHQLQEFGMHTAVMDEIQRQRANPELLEAARLAAEGRGAEALEKLDVREFKTKTSRHEAIAQAYVNGDPSRTLVLTGSNSDRRALNLAIRSKLQQSEGMSQVTVQIFDRSDFTAAEKKLADSWEIGSAVRFEKQYKSLGIAKGAVGLVAGFSDNKIIITMPNGSRVPIEPARIAANNVTLGQIENRQIAEGEYVRFSASGKGVNGTEFSNGDKGRIYWRPPELEGGTWQMFAKLDRNGKAVQLDPSAIGIPMDYGYVQTGHSAQGLGEHTVLIDRDPSSKTVSERSFYTDLTRATHNAVVFTSDRDQLAAAVKREVSKAIALEPDFLAPEKYATQSRLTTEGVSGPLEMGNQRMALAVTDDLGPQTEGAAHGNPWAALLEKAKTIAEKHDLAQRVESLKTKLKPPEISLGD